MQLCEFWFGHFKIYSNPDLVTWNCMTAIAFQYGV